MDSPRCLYCYPKGAVSMFEDSLFDSGAGSRPRKTWPKLVSFALEAGAIGVLVLLPFLYTQALPKQLWTDILENPTPPPGAAPTQTLHSQPRTARDNRALDDKVLREPGYIPLKTAMVRDEPASAEGPPNMEGVVPGGVPG